MGNTLLERQTVILKDSFYAACLIEGCLVKANGRMLCAKHERAGRAEGWLWQYPDWLMDDYSGEGEDKLWEICDWFFAYDMDTFMETVHEYGEWSGSDLVVKFLDRGEFNFSGRLRQVGFGGYGVDENGKCHYCLKNVAKKRTLCETCYSSEHDADHLYRYPTSKYRSNVKGHIWWMLRYQPERLRAIARGYGVEISISGL